MYTFLALFPAAISSHFISISLARTHSFIYRWKISTFERTYKCLQPEQFRWWEQVGSMHGIAILWHVRVLLSMCRHHISRKMHTDNKMKGEKSQQTKIEMENRQHQACSYYVYNDDENVDNDDDDNLNIVYVCWVFSKWNYRVGLLTSKICAHSCMQDHISFPQTDNPMLKHKGNIFDTFVWVFICYTV